MCSGGKDDGRGCGHDTFIRRDKLETWRVRLLLKDDCLVIRCDVGIIVIDHLRLRSIAVGPKRSRSARDDTDTESSSYSDNTDTENSSYSDDSCFDTDSDESQPSWRRSKRRRCRQLTRLDDREYILRTFES